MKHTQVTPADLLHGLDEIAAYVRMTVPQVKHKIQIANWPTFKMGRTVCARPSALAAHFAKLEREATRGQ